MNYIKDAIVRRYQGWKGTINEFDTDGDGKLDRQELENLKKQNLSPDLRRILDEADTDQDQQLSVEEMKAVMSKIDEVADFFVLD